MRNLKRVLSLSLALVMMLGMMIIGASAAEATKVDFADAGEITNTEAVDVMVALGVIEGDGTNFNPANILTREQAAKIICYMLMGPENAEKLSKNSSVFTDVAAGRWSAGYIAYCANLGILAGNGDGTFAPEGELTGVAFGKMLLVALGYDAEIEGYVGNNWATSIASDMIAAGIDVKGVSLDAPLSRDNACQMAFQTLTADMVKYSSKGTAITTSDGTKIIMGASDAAPYTGGTEYNQVTGATTSAYLQFCEKYFPNLKKADGNVDDFKRPAAYKWYIDNDNTNTYNATKDTLAYNAAETAAVVATATPTNNTLAKLAAANDLTIAGTGATYKRAQDGTDSTYAVDKDTNLYSAYGKCKVEFFTNAAGDVDEIIAYNYTLIKITNVTDLTANQIKALTGADKGSTKSVTFDIAGGGSATIKDARFANFNYAKGDYVLAVLKSGNTDILASVPATTVEGKVDAIKNSTYRIGGTFYGVAGAQIGTVTAPAIGDSGKWVVDADGKLAAAIDVSTKSSNYAYVYRIVYNATGVDADGYTTANATVYAVLTDGSKVAYPTTLTSGTYVKGDISGATFGDVTTNNGASTTKAVVAYSIVDGKFEVAAATDLIKVTASTEDVDKTDAQVNSTDGGVYFCNSDTAFVFANEVGGTKMTVTTATGYKNVSITDKAIMFVANGTSKTVLYAFVADANAYAASTSATVAVLLDAAAVQTGTGTAADPTMYTYSVAVDGEVTDLKLTATQKAALDAVLGTPAAGQVFSYTITNGTLSATLYSTTATVSYVNGNQAQIGGVTKDLTGSDIYTVSYDKKTVTAGGSLNAQSGKDGNTVILVDLNGSDGVIDYVFIMNEVNPNA